MSGNRLATKQILKVMAGSLLDALSKVGLISEHEKEQVLADQSPSIAEREAHWHKLARTVNRTEHYAQLHECSSVNEFKDTAKKLLADSPEKIDEVVKIAHRFKGEDGGAKLIWLCYEVKRLMPQVNPHKRERFLKRAFRSAGSVVEIPI